MKAGYLYVLVHPSDPNLFKVGVTTLRPEQRLAQHNRLHNEHAGRVVKETGQDWTLETVVSVPDVFWAEAAFWRATGLADIPFLGGVEVQKMERRWVEAGLAAARSAGIRPAKELPDWVHANAVWMRGQLEGRGITLLGDVRSKFGKSNFRCSNGHEWRATPSKVASGEGCPTCGIGLRVEPPPDPVMHLLLHPERPGFIRIAVTQGLPHAPFEDGWQTHRYRRVEDAALAQALIWPLLGVSEPANGEPACVDVLRAEQAFRELIYAVRRELAAREKGRQTGK